MKKLILPLSLCLCLVGARAQDTLLIFHPTAYNLELFLKLHEDKVLDLEGYHLLGVYHSGESYD